MLLIIIFSVFLSWKCITLVHTCPYRILQKISYIDGFKMSRPSLGSSHPPIHWVLYSFPGLMRPGHETGWNWVPFWSCSQAVSKPVWHIPLLCVQWKTPDDGQRNCPKHVDFYSKNKFEKSVHLVGFIIRKLSVMSRSYIRTPLFSFVASCTGSKYAFGWCILDEQASLLNVPNSNAHLMKTFLSEFLYKRGWSQKKCTCW